MPEREAPILPADARGWYLKARAAEARGDQEAADRALAWVLRLDRADPWAWVHVAEHHLQRGDWIEAREHAAEALRRAPDLAEAHRVAGLAEAATGHPDALHHLEQAGDLPGVLGARVRLRGDASLLGSAPPPQGSEEALDRARAALDVGDAALALVLARPVLEDAGWGPAALDVAAVAGASTCGLQEVYRWAAARPGLVEDPRWRDALVELAEAAGDDALLEDLLRRGEGAAYAAWLRSRGRTGDALAWLEGRPVRSATEELWLVALRADARLGAGDAEGALALTDGHEHHPTVAWVRAGALVALGAVEEAVDLARRTGGDPVDEALRAGRVRLAAGQREEALEAWRASGQAPLLAARAEVLGTAEAWTDVLEVDPAHPLAREALAVADPARADDLLPADSCDPAVLIARARLTEGCEARERWARAALARPADPEVRRGLDEATRACAGG